MTLTRPNDQQMGETLSFVDAFFAQHGCTPTIREVCDHFELKSKETGHRRVQDLIRAGYLARRGDRLCLVHWKGSDELAS